MNVKIEESWKKSLISEFEKPYFENLVATIKKEHATQTIYPPAHLIFSAFDTCHLSDVKVVIIGQDPYHGFGQANGLSFSVNDGIALPPSLVNIFKEIETDLNISCMPSGNLIRWAKQGVFMLNSTLTVRANLAGSHKDIGWETFTDAVIEKISDMRDNVVFLLWGNYAQKKGNKIDSSKHLILQSGHPSPLSANRGLWFGNKHFSISNNYLIKNNLSPIDWR